MERRASLEVNLTDDVVDLLLVVFHAVHVLLQGGQLVGRLAGVEPAQTIPGFHAMLLAKRSQVL